MLVVDPEGKAFPVVSTSGLVQSGKEFRFSPRRLSGNLLWALASGHFIEIDLSTGKVVEDFGDVATDAKDQFYGISGRSTKEGLYRIADGRGELITWAGERKDLGPATLD